MRERVTELLWLWLLRDARHTMPLRHLFADDAFLRCLLRHTPIRRHAAANNTTLRYDAAARSQALYARAEYGI